MKIYFSHSRGEFDYKNGLYLPLRHSPLNKAHEFIFPHEKSEEPFDSRLLLPELGLFCAEVSYPSTGLGMELAFAFGKVPIACFCKADTKPARSLARVTEYIYTYTSIEQFMRLVGDHVSDVLGEDRPGIRTVMPGAYTYRK